MTEHRPRQFEVVPPTMPRLHLEVIADRTGAPEWRVEYCDQDGGCYVTIFAGPAGEARAKAYWTALQLGEIDIIVAADVPPPA
jgi:hypothetical protein